MPEDQGQMHDTRKRAEHQSTLHGAVQGRLPTPGPAPAYSSSLLDDPRLNARGNGPVKIALMRQMQQTYGNRAIQRLLASAKRDVQRACACEGRAGSAGDSEEYPRESYVQPTRLIMRKLAVEQPADKIKNPDGKGLVQTNAATIENYLKMLCSSGGVKVDGGTGEVTIDNAFCSDPSKVEDSGTPSGCKCICDLANSANGWKFEVDDSGEGPYTQFTNEAKAHGKEPGGSGGAIHTPSPNSAKIFGSATESGKLLDTDSWLLLGHELCGHAWLGNSGRHGEDTAKRRGIGGHQKTVELENELRIEHGIDLRGTFKDPYCGESYWREKANPEKINWSKEYELCKRWREEYNEDYGTNYKISDKLPNNIL